MAYPVQKVYKFHNVGIVDMFYPFSILLSVKDVAHLIIKLGGKDFEAKESFKGMETRGGHDGCSLGYLSTKHCIAKNEAQRRTLSGKSTIRDPPATMFGCDPIFSPPSCGEASVDREVESVCASDVFRSLENLGDIW